MTAVFKTFGFFCICIVLCNDNCVNGRIRRGVQTYPPPEPKYGFEEVEQIMRDAVKVRQTIKRWKPNDENHLWELSGLDEGDIMHYKWTAGDLRNGVLDLATRWPRAIVPFYIAEEDFTDEQVRIILGGMDEYHQKTCIRFRPHRPDDENFIVIHGNSTGCWSAVGMHTQGQVVNFQQNGCVRHGIVVHELLHALGFFHQQSATERDDFVQIFYRNIIPSMFHNFIKYNASDISSYNVPYDYRSVMHYSQKAFSKNGMNTIEAVDAPFLELGQRVGLSVSDVEKLNRMYQPIFCHNNSFRSSMYNFNPRRAMRDWFY